MSRPLEDYALIGDTHTAALVAGRLIGNFPQALSHIPLVSTAFNLTSSRGPSHARAPSGERSR